MNKRLRIVIDSGRVLLLPLLMAYSLAGEAAHEYLGIEMSLLFVTHHILNVAWWKHLLRGKYTPIRILGTVINLALVVIMLALPISGMILSRYVFRSLDLGEAATARTVHLLASYWGLVLMSFHAGMHGNRIMGDIVIQYRKQINVQTGICDNMGNYKKEEPSIMRKLLLSIYYFFNFKPSWNASPTRSVTL